MKTYRQIQNEIEFAHQIWEKEESFPEWFKAASYTWTPDYESFLSFWNNCGEIYGLFDNDELIAVVYLEFLTKQSVNVHVSVVGKAEAKILERFFRSLLKLKTSDGIKQVSGWIAKQNRALIKIADNAGFKPTGLKMLFGECKGKVITWIEVRN